MIIALLFLIGFVLILFSFFLLKKQAVFLTLLQSAEKEKHPFLTTYGWVFFALGISSCLLAPFAQKESALFFIAVMLLVSGHFSYQFSKKMG
ncbi:hypothetical protein ACYSNO_10460 [Enterococcus sp. LJL98]